MIVALDGNSGGQNCRGRPRTVWNDVVLFNIHKLKLNCYTCDALNKPVWRELTCVPDACWLSTRFIIIVIIVIIIVVIIIIIIIITITIIIVIMATLSNSLTVAFC